MDFVAQPFRLGYGQNALINLRGFVLPGQLSCRVRVGLSVLVEPEPDPELPDPGGGHSSGTAAELGSYRPDGSRDGRPRAVGQKAVRAVLSAIPSCHRDRARGRTAFQRWPSARLVASVSAASRACCMPFLGDVPRPSRWCCMASQRYGCAIRMNSDADPCDVDCQEGPAVLAGKRAAGFEGLSIQLSKPKIRFASEIAYQPSR